ncbi:MAG: septation regulator SpoVG [Clostridia bacterium]|nr:septation regulator SpoVG [Clostridia bacterium]MBR6751273.1 septation regulator SpoVG [Clostridia bacterium]
MNITDVRVKVIRKGEGKLRAVASIVFDNAFVVHDIKVIEGSNGNFIVMPSRKSPDGEYRDIAHPLRNETREEIKELILNAYEVALKEE